MKYKVTIEERIESTGVTKDVTFNTIFVQEFNTLDAEKLIAELKTTG